MHKKQVIQLPALDKNLRGVKKVVRYYESIVLGMKEKKITGSEAREKINELNGLYQEYKTNIKSPGKQFSARDLMVGSILKCCDGQKGGLPRVNNTDYSNSDILEMVYNGTYDKNELKGWPTMDFHRRVRQ